MRFKSWHLKVNPMSSSKTAQQSHVKDITAASWLTKKTGSCSEQKTILDPTCVQDCTSHHWTITTPFSCFRFVLYFDTTLNRRNEELLFRHGHLMSRHLIPKSYLGVCVVMGDILQVSSDSGDVHSHFKSEFELSLLVFFCCLKRFSSFLSRFFSLVVGG